MRDYEQAEKCFKMMLKYSWISDTPSLEIEAYDGLAKACYYLLDLKRSNDI